MFKDRTSRRRLLKDFGAACGAAWIGSSGAQAADLPLKNTGIEHFGMTVPDPEATARFYGKIFDPQLFQERDPPPRFYVRLGTGYLAFGGNANVQTAYLDHFCALTEGYAQGELRKLLEAAGVSMGAGALGMANDPDGLRLQTLNVPGGLARTIIPGPRISQDDALFQVIGPDHVILHVSDLEKSAAHYRKLFGAELPRTKKPERVWFGAARTKLGLEQVSAGEKPSIHHISVRVAGFDRNKAAEKLKRAGVEVVPSSDKTVTFRDPHGIVMELRGDV